MMPRRKTGILLVALMMLSSISPFLVTAGPADGDGGGDEVRQGSPLGPEDAMVQYAILTSSGFVNELQRLADWKTEKGVYAKVYPSDWVTNHYQGRDSRAQVHAFLRDLFNHTDGGLGYLLIAADHEVIRAREIHTGIKVGWEPYSGGWVYSDHYYAGLDHDWDADGDGLFGELGETDWDAEIAVGRAPVSNLEEAGDVVDKLLAYELDPDVGDWMRRAVLVSSVMNPPNANESNAHHPDDIYKWWEDNAWESIERTIPLVPGHMEQHVLYDYNQIWGGNYTPENDTLNKSSYIAALDMGSSVFASVTHGWIPSGNGTPHYVGDGIGFNWSSAFYYTDIQDLKNGNMTPFIYFSSCYIGNFTELDDSNFERLLTDKDRGAIGFIAPSENTYRGEENPESSDGNWWMSETFWKNMFRGEPRPGDAFYQMIRDYEPHLRSVGANPDSPYFRQNHAAYNLIGDPEMPIWFDVPGELTLRLPDAIYDVEYDVPFRVTDGAVPVEGARVCLKGEDFYAFADTDSDGWAIVHVNPLLEGQSVTVTATKPQYLPFQTTMGVAPLPAELTVVARTIRASTTRPEAGAPTELRAEVRNLGHDNAPEFSVEFYDGDPDSGGELVSPAVVVPGLPPETSAPVTVTWTAPSAGWHDIYVVADAADDIEEVLEENNVASASIMVSAMNARATLVEVDGGGGSTALPYNTETNIAVHVTSTGTATLMSVPVRLFLGDPAAGGRAIGPDRTVTSVAPGTTQVLLFPYTPASTGRFKLVAVVDPEDGIMEFDELDNEADLWVTVGHPPLWDAVPIIQMVEDNPKELDLTRYLTDYDTDMADLEVTVFSIGTVNVDATIAGKVLRIQPDRDWFGSFDLEVMVDDGDFTAIADLAVTVAPSNDPPRFRNEVPSEPFNLTEGQRFSYIFDAYDPDGETVTFTDNSDLFDVSPDGVIDYTPSFEDIAYSPIHVFLVIASDGVAQSFFPMILQLVTENTPPELYLPEYLFLVVGQPLTFRVDATDREGDQLTFVEDSDFFEIVAGTGQFGFTPTASMVGQHTVTFNVTDGTHHASGEVEFIIYDKEEEERDTSNVTIVVLTAQIALVVIGLLYIVNFRRRVARERANTKE